VALEDGLKVSPKHVRQKEIRKHIKKLVHCVGYYTIPSRNV
jgi:hypothetical protein